MTNSSLLVIFNIWFFILVMIKHTAFPYNLDVDNTKIFNIPKNFNKRASYFGFSVAFYENEINSILLVGAPRANVSAKQNLNEPGCVYTCPIRSKCTQWDITDQYTRKQHLYDISINASWVGATIAVEKKVNPSIMVCAPRWQFVRGSEMVMPGICYLDKVETVTPFTTKVEFEILPPISHSYYSSGFSLHIPHNSSNRIMMLGSPGLLWWVGAPLMITGLSQSKSRLINPFEKDKQLESNSYFGYSVTSGYYFGKPKLWYASGAPNAANMYGVVKIFKLVNDLAVVNRTINGEQYGEYFGATLTSCDLNNDGKDELIIGAPLWTKDMDEGRIYIFKNSHGNMFERHVFEGEISGGRFGTIATCLGDIDYDGYSDFAVGAPYVEDTGAIYIFNGNGNGLIKRYSQKIIGKQIEKNIRGFGISISEPRDINNDKYPDIAVGAYLSDQAILIKSKPAIILKTLITYAEEEKLLQNSTHFFINICTTYDGIFSPKKLDVVHFLKIDQLHGRVFGDEQELGKSIGNTYKFIQSVSVHKNVCNKLKIHLKNNIQNVLDPIEISTSVALKEDLQYKNKTEKPNIFCTNCASINKDLSKTEHSIKLPFAVDCGEDNICTSDVRIKLSTDLGRGNIYTIGSTSTVKLVIDAYNHGEPAYQLKVCVYIPELLPLARIPPTCSESSNMHNTLEVICDIGNPLRNKESLSLQLDMSEIRYDIKEVELTANFTMQSNQKDSSTNADSLNINFSADIDVTIAGKAHTDLYSYYYDEKHKLNNVQFEHIYEVQKFGVSPLEKVILAVSIPSYWKHSTGDVHIINLNKTNGNMDGQQFYCTYTSISTIYPRNSIFDVQEEFQSKTNFSLSLPPMNRSIYLNCSNTDIHCTYLECALGPFTVSTSVAKLTLTLDLYLKSFEPTMLEMKDIVLVLTNGSVHITQPYNIITRNTNKPHNAFVATTFIGSPVTEQLALWIIILSVILGIILLIFLILGLIALGFFNRKKREELKTLKSDMNNKNATIVTTSSEREDVY
ncbi:integrin alpha-8 [Megalopta genalis]|uniref:integrin alpha-8 n=1 Tax=Megalopta genalis TaxID=115081 RepID=UPI003FD55522